MVIGLVQFRFYGWRCASKSGGQPTFPTSNYSEPTITAFCLLPPASCLLLPASCLLLPAFCLLLPALAIMRADENASTDDRSRGAFG